MELDFLPSKITVIKFSLITSCDVERLFSWYKSMLRPYRCNFNFENLKHYIMACLCFALQWLKSQNNKLYFVKIKKKVYLIQSYYTNYIISILIIIHLKINCFR